MAASRWAPRVLRVLRVLLLLAGGIILWLFLTPGAAQADERPAEKPQPLLHGIVDESTGDVLGTLTESLTRTPSAALASVLPASEETRRLVDTVDSAAALVDDVVAGLVPRSDPPTAPTTSTDSPADEPRAQRARAETRPLPASTPPPAQSLALGALDALPRPVPLVDSGATDRGTRAPQAPTGEASSSSSGLALAALPGGSPRLAAARPERPQPYSDHLTSGPTYRPTFSPD